jgi:hypothetical protein
MGAMDYIEDRKIRLMNFLRGKQKAKRNRASPIQESTFSYFFIASCLRALMLSLRRLRRRLISC